MQKHAFGPAVSFLVILIGVSLDGFRNLVFSAEQFWKLFRAWGLLSLIIGLASHLCGPTAEINVDKNNGNEISAASSRAGGDPLQKMFTSSEATTESSPKPPMSVPGPENPACTICGMYGQSAGVTEPEPSLI